MKIVHLITGLNVGGAETMLFKLLSNMDAGRFENHVVSLSDIGVVGARIRSLGLPVYGLGMRPGRPTPRSLRVLMRLLRGQRPSVLQSWMYHADLVGLPMGRLCRVPRVVWNVRCSDFVGNSSRRTTGWVSKACATMSAYPDAVIVNSDAGRRFHSALGYHPKQWLVIPNGFDLGRYKADPRARMRVGSELRLDPSSLVVGMVARYDATKDHQTFVRAAGALNTKRPGVHFLLAGRGVTWANDTLVQWIDEAGVRDRMHLLGEREDVPELLSSLDIATLSSSHSEGFPNVIGEAMSCEAPCVVTDVGDSAAIVADSGIVVPPRDPTALAAGWLRLLDLGPEKRSVLGGKARERVQQHYSLDHVVTRYQDLYLSLVGD
ncbi:MAG: hypothetical protein DLM70_03855 [Chloroflexi bacterium]|nr:MAG: hypothetical protein DLM70_03855 [Chloroflexota bacterium]